MLVKAAAAQQQRRPRIEHHRHQQRRPRLDSEDSQVAAESMLSLLLERRRRADAQRRQERVLPSIIASGPGNTIWRRSTQLSHRGCMVYQDIEAPNRLLHVIPDDHDDDAKEDADENKNRDCCRVHERPMNNNSSNQRMDSISYKGRALRCPAPLGYVGIPLPVAPSLPPPEQKPRYLVRPRFPTIV